TGLVTDSVSFNFANIKSTQTGTWHTAEHHAVKYGQLRCETVATVTGYCDRRVPYWNSHHIASKGECHMGIKSKIRLSYYKAGIPVPVTDTRLYPNGTNVISEVDIDQDWYDAVIDSIEAASHLIDTVVSIATDDPFGAIYS